jgi:BolA family transcriptional regulator, general stress-responsive regulator
VSERIERMRQRLAALAPDEIEIIDESHLHAGHAGARSGRGHYALRIRAAAFAGKTPIQRHRMVYEALGDMLQTDIHALGIKALAPEE